MAYIRKNMGYFGIYWFKIVGYIEKTIGYTSPLDILIKIYGIY